MISTMMMMTLFKQAIGENNMKLNRRRLRDLIMEVLSEHRIKPTLPAHIPNSHVAKINSLIDRGSVEQAHSLVDALGGPDDYVDNYIAYMEVGDMERLGNEAAALYEPVDPFFPGGYRALHPDSLHDLRALDDKAYDLARSKTDSYLGSDDYNLDRYSRNRNPNRYPDDFLE